MLLCAGQEHERTQSNIRRSLKYSPPGRDSAGRKKGMDMILKELRNEARLSQFELSEKSGVNLRMIQKYETQERDIKKASGETLQKLAVTLGCKMEDLMK